MPNIKKEIKLFVENEFKNKVYFTIIYGSYAYGINKDYSDLDLITVCESFKQNQVERMTRFIVHLHKKYNLKIDSEVPYEKKLLVNIDLFEKGIKAQGFKIKNRKICIPMIVKTKEFLKSDKMIMRLALNAITSKNIFIAGDYNHYTKRREEALKNMIKIIFSTKGIEHVTLQKFVSFILGTGEESGELYLGYKNDVKIKEYLKRTFKMIFESLVRQKWMKKQGDIYIKNNNKWFNEILN